MSVFLGLERCEDRVDFTAACGFIQFNERIGGAKISMILRDLVFQDELVPKGVPGQLGNYPVILVQIVTVMGEDEIGRHSFLQQLEVVLDLAADVREEAVPETLDENVLLSCSREKNIGAVDGLAPPLCIRAEHNPCDIEWGFPVR